MGKRAADSGDYTWPLNDGGGALLDVPYDTRTGPQRRNDRLAQLEELVAVQGEIIQRQHTRIAQLAQAVKRMERMVRDWEADS